MAAKGHNAAANGCFIGDIGQGTENQRVMGDDQFRAEYEEFAVKYNLAQ